VEANLIRLSDADISSFSDDGVICLRGLFESKWVERLSVGLEKNFADPGPDSTIYTPEGEPGCFYDDYCNWQRIREYREFIMESAAAEIAGQLMRSSSARIYHEHVLVKEPGTQEVTPWHHDQPYYGVEGDQLCSIWLPLDPVPKSACPEFVAGTHTDGTLFKPRLFVDHSSYAGSAPAYQDVPDIDAQRDDRSILSWDLQLGDCIVFHMRTLHGAPSTVGLTTRRRGFSTRWLGDDARFAVRPWVTSPPYHDLDLVPGAPMQHPLFPVIWSI
jgi:ectoine hydroxylase-related dioxygenase (phytanoyl-CoA dioxygenase family)